MLGVIRFLDHPLFPASAPDDYPKIIKSGIDEEGQHPKSPPITGASGIATLLYKFQYPSNLLFERLFDVDAVENFLLMVKDSDSYISDIYVQRSGRDVEIGFINNAGEWARHGVRYFIKDEGMSPYRFGKWVPISTSDRGSSWGGTDAWIHAQGAAVAKAIEWHCLHRRTNLVIEWSKMTQAEKDDIQNWLDQRKVQLAEEKLIEKKYRDEWMEVWNMHAEMNYGMYRYYQTRLICRAACGEKKPSLVCSRCKITYYCSTECQKDDWKYHKTLCGYEEPVPETYRAAIQQAE